MTKEIRMTNDQIIMAAYLNQRSVEDNGLGEEVFWGGNEDQRVYELHEAGDGKRVYDLEERTALFGEAIIRFAKKIPQNPVNNRLVAQLVRAGTSVGANYCEADDGVS